LPVTARGNNEPESPGGNDGEATVLRDLTQAEAAAEFKTLADNIPTLCWMARADGHIYWYNRRWYEYTGTSIETQMGWGWETVHDPEVLPVVVERWRHSLATGTSFEMTFPLKGADGKFRPFLTRVVPIRDDSGTVVRWFGTNTEIEAVQVAQQALQQRTAELESLYDSAPIGLAVVSRDYRYLRVNRELAAINGVPAEQHIGRTLREVLGEEGSRIEPIIDQVFATGAAISNLEFSGRSLAEPGQLRHFLAGFYPNADEHGTVAAVGGWVIEISERKTAEERETLLAREVDHRAKNLLAVVQSVVQLTDAADVAMLKEGIIGRIQSLARAHSLLADARWDGAQLEILAAEELEPYRGASGARITVDGPPLLLRPAAAQSIAMVLHELATNAAKYGALSTAGGQLEVAWRRTGDSVELQWRESGGPAVTPPASSGFGAKIIRTSVERQLHGKFEQDWRPEGLHCTITISAKEAFGAGAL
jgi:PAS domain S-box-containing protein